MPRQPTPSLLNEVRELILKTTPVKQHHGFTPEEQIPLIYAQDGRAISLALMLLAEHLRHGKPEDVRFQDTLKAVQEAWAAFGVRATTTPVLLELQDRLRGLGFEQPLRRNRA